MDRQVVRGERSPAALLLVALVAWSVLTFGAVYPWAYWPLLVVALGLGGHAVLEERAWRDPRLLRVLLSLAVVLVAIGVQTVRLPASLVVELSPGVDRFFRAFQLGYDPSQLSALSLDPAATRVVLFEALALGMLFVGITRSMRRWSLRLLTNDLMLIGVLISILGILQKAVLPSDTTPLIYGFWQTERGGQPFGPFVNRNHFAGWMVMLVPLVAAYAWALVAEVGGGVRRGAAGWLRSFSAVDGNRTFLVVTALLIMLVAVALTGSRSGLVAGGVGLLTFLGLLWQRLSGRARGVVTVAVAFMFIGATLWAGAGNVTARFRTAGGDASGRLAAWQDTWRIVDDFTMFGTGLGGYRSAMTVYQTRDRDALYAQAHNDYLQLLAEGGLLVAIPAVVLAVFVVAGVVRRLRAGDADPATYWLRRGAVAGLVAIAAQSVVEFSLQMPGNAVLFVTVAAIALHRPRHHSSHAHRV